MPQVSDRNLRKKWEKDGSKDGAKRAGDIVRSVLETHEPLKIDKEVFEKIKSRYDEYGIIQPS